MYIQRRMQHISQIQNEKCPKQLIYIMEIIVSYNIDKEKQSPLTVAKGNKHTKLHSGYHLFLQKLYKGRKDKKSVRVTEIQ